MTESTILGDNKRGVQKDTLTDLMYELTHVFTRGHNAYRMYVDVGLLACRPQQKYIKYIIPVNGECMMMR